ncbi:unnamed protein product [Oikopleura dioica]|uniref:Uncharacterized protein n=1 Tax=Oikopleura dioica TaxID=34765 RepID=E4XMI5_OIKDI|nr:unnamed protein product [Oikopleura dioica]
MILYPKAGLCREGASSAELLEQAQNPNRLVSDWLEKSVNENPEELNSRYGQSVQEVSTHFAHKAINQNEESAENRRKSYPNEENPEKTRKISKILSLILGEGPSSSTLPTRESEVSDEYPEQAREIDEIKQKIDLEKVSADELRKLAESVELLQSKNGSKNEASSIQAEDEMNQSATAERSDSKQFKEEGSNKQQLESETKASDFSLKKNTSKSSVKSSKPARSTSSIQNQELKITESIDYYGNSSKDEAPADAPDDRQLINNESASSQSPIIDVVRSLDNLEPLSPTSESVENVSTHEKSIKTASKISFQEIIAQTSTDDLVRVLSQVSKKTSRADIMEKLASATNLAASNDDKKSSISAAESFGRKSSSIPAHDKTFLEGGSISSNKSNKDQDRKSGSSKVSRPISQARSAASSTRSADSPVLSQNGEDEKLSTKSGSSKISRASMPVSQTRSAAFSSRSLGENESAVLSQNSEDEKLSTKSGSSKASLDRILRKSSGRSSVGSEKKITDNLADDKSTKSSRMPEANQGELNASSEEENVPKKLISELLNSIESGDEKEDKSFSETEEAKEREDLKEPSTSQRRITRGKLRSFISEKSLKSVRSGSQASIAAGKSIEEKHYISRTDSVKSTGDVIRSSNSVANSVLNDILKVTKEDTSEELITNEDTGEITQETMLSGSNNSLAEKKRSEKDHAFKVPPTPKPSRATSPRLEEHRKSVPESAIDILRDLQEPGDLPSTPFNSKSSLNSDKQSLQVEEESRISIAESPESRRKTIPESAIDVLRELQQPKDLPSTPANSLDSQNSHTRSEDTKVSVAASSNPPDRRKTIPESAIDILRDLQQSKDLPSTPHPSKTSINSDKISDPNLFPDDQLPRKSILESAIEIIQNQEATKSSSELSNDQNLMTDTDGEGFSETEEAKNMDEDIEQTSQRRITRGKLQSFIKSQESVVSGASVRSKNQVLSTKTSQKSATSSRGIISNNSFGKEIIEDQAENPPSISSTKSEDEKSMTRKSSLRSRKSSSGSSNSNNTAGNYISEDGPPVIQRRITRGKLSSFIKSKEMLSSQSHKYSNSENDEQDEILNNSNSESRASIRTKSRQSIADSKISKSSIVSEKISERSVTKEIDAQEEIIADSLILSENADNAKSESKISTRSRKSSKIEEDHPIRTSSSIAKSLVREITEMQEPQASPSRSTVKSTRSSIKSQTSVSKKDELQSDEIVKIALDIYESFLSSTTREIIEEVSKDEGVAIESNSDISLRSSEYSKTSVKEETSASKSLSIKSSKRSQASDRSSRRSSARLRSQKSGEIPIRTHSSIANSFVRHVLDDAQKNLVEEKDAEGSSEKSEISEKSSTVISEHKIDKTLSKLEEINRASSHSSGSQQLSDTSMPNSENPSSFKNIDSDFELNKPKATSSRVSTRSRRTENSEKSSTVEGTKSSRVSTRSRSSSKKSVTEKFSNNSTDNLSNRPRKV